MSKVKTIIFFLVFLLSPSIYSQIETVDPQNEIYDFLKVLSLKRVITGYDDIVLPLSKLKILTILKQAFECKDITAFEKEMIQREIIKYQFPNGDINSEFLYNISNYNEKPIYFFIHSDSSVNFQINPIVEEKFIYSLNDNSTSNLFNFGGTLKGTYLNKLGFELKAQNGIQSGEKQIALIDQNVKQSFTFNRTGINYFDLTEGSLRYEDKTFNVEIGRKRILWGYGKEKINISSNAPIFDFIKLTADFNFFNINFLHGWLVQPLEYKFDSTALLYRKIKNPKYLALSRFGFRPSECISFGITQTIIYANRPLEAAYLNPFLFFESAQRSMNDLDNSFLGFDLKLHPIKGLQFTSEIMFDDFNFKNIKQNRFALELNVFLSNPLLPDNILFDGGIIKIDPYLYSHEGVGESLTYTNNSFLLGPNLQPNSLKYFFYITYFLETKLHFIFQYEHMIHGGNVYDNNGNLLENKGGNILEPLRKGDSLKSKLLSGIREEEQNLLFSVTYNALYGLYLSFNYKLDYSRSVNHILWSGAKFDF